MSTLDINTIIIEILPRLPAKSLARFKSVCKSFNTVISSRDFIQLHLRHHTVSSVHYLTLAANRHIKCYNIDLHCHPTLTTPSATFIFDKHSVISVIGSSNGLLCIFRTHRSINYLSILNPTTRISRYIETRIHGGSDRVHNFGFGFNHTHLDYNIVAVSDFRDESAVKTRVTKVYSLNKTSWSVIKSEIPTDTMEERHGGVLIDGHLLHWLFWVPSLRKRRIGCFNVCEGNWVNDVLLPQYYYDPTHWNYLLDFGAVEGCLFSTFENKIENRFDVWVMEEYGVQESWVILLRVSVSDRFAGGVVPVAWCRSSDLVLIRVRHSCKLFWFDKADGGISEAMFDGAPDFTNLQVYMCCSSSVDLPGGIYFGTPSEQEYLFSRFRKENELPPVGGAQSRRRSLT